MAIFHFTRKFVSRGQGQSVVATAAYQSRSNLYNEQDGLQKNYTRHGEQEVLESFIFAPKDAPEWVFDREKLWNAAERAEDEHNKTRAKSARTAQHIELALPHELDTQQNRRLVQDFVRDNFTRKGFICDVNIHSADRHGDQRNTHAHILVTMRQLDGQALSAKKDHLKQDQLKEQINHWRENWAKQQSRHLERAGFKMEAARMIYGHKTLEEQQKIAELRNDHTHAEALKREATQHEGATATQMKREGKGEQSRIVDFNQQAANRRAQLEKNRAELRSVEAAQERIFYANTTQGKLHRTEKIHDWQRDKLALKQERERLKLKDAHTWQRRDEVQAPEFAAILELERVREQSDLENKHKAEAAALYEQQREKIDRIAAKMLYNAEHQDTLAAMNEKRHHTATMRPKGYRGQRGTVREVRDDIQEQRKDTARNYQAGQFTEHYTESDALKAEREKNQAARERQEKARQEPEPQQKPEAQKTRAELRDEELKQTRGQRMKPPRRPKRPDGV